MTVEVTGLQKANTDVFKACFGDALRYVFANEIYHGETVGFALHQLETGRHQVEYLGTVDVHAMREFALQQYLSSNKCLQEGVKVFITD